MSWPLALVLVVALLCSTLVALVWVTSRKPPTVNEAIVRATVEAHLEKAQAQAGELLGSLLRPGPLTEPALPSRPGPGVL